MSAHALIFPGKPGNSDIIDYSSYTYIRILSDSLVCIRSIVTRARDILRESATVRHLPCWKSNDGGNDGTPNPTAGSHADSVVRVYAVCIIILRGCVLRT